MTAKRNVKRGAELLDERFPDWYQIDFDWDAFDIDSLENCMLGQLYRLGAFGEVPAHHSDGCSYARGKRALFRGAGTTTEYGFASGSLNKHELKTIWQEEVNTRLGTRVIVREVEVGVRLNPTEKELLLELLGDRAAEIEEQLGALKPQYRKFLEPQKMTVQALRVAIRDV